jgi:predicted transcriptional regulator
MRTTPSPGPVASSGWSRISRAGSAAGYLDPSRRAVPDLGPLESAIMDVVWEAGEAVTARVVLGRLEYTAHGGTLPSYSAVTTVMTILQHKGLLARARKPGRYGHRAPWWYHPCLSREEHLATVVRAALACARDPAAVLRLAQPGSSPSPSLVPSAAGWPGPMRPVQVLAGLRAELAARGVTTGGMVATRLQATLGLPGGPAITCRGGWLTWPAHDPACADPSAWAVHWAGDLAGATGRLASPGKSTTSQSR